MLYQIHIIPINFIRYKPLIDTVFVQKTDCLWEATMIFEDGDTLTTYMSEN